MAPLQPLLPTGKSAKAQVLPAPHGPPAPLLQRGHALDAHVPRLGTRSSPKRDCAKQEPMSKTFTPA